MYTCRQCNCFSFVKKWNSPYIRRESPTLFTRILYRYISVCKYINYIIGVDVNFYRKKNFICALDDKMKTGLKTGFKRFLVFGDKTAAPNLYNMMLSKYDLILIYLIILYYIIIKRKSLTAMTAEPFMFLFCRRNASKQYFCPNETYSRWSDYI